MKKLMLAVLAFTLALWVVAGTQLFARQTGSQQSQSDQNQANSQTQPSAKTGQNQNMSGNVSANGKKFVSDKNNKSYKVDNPDALKGHENQHVAIIVHVDPDTGDLHIMQVEAPEQ
jgi:hypothetical protein